jgi:FkbM family methyltransferase
MSPEIAPKACSYSPPPEQTHLESILDNASSLFFIQIGANDGLDFVRTVVRRYRDKRVISGILLEPQPHFYARLQTAYAGIPAIEILNCAVSDSAESRTLYHIDYRHQDVPVWSRGLGTFSKETLLSHRHLINNLESRVRELPVQCITVADLLQRTRGAQLDVLITDTEGHDLVILKQFDFTRVRPRLIVYESKHLSPADFAFCEKMLEQSGYRITHLHNDNSIARLT